MVQAAKKTHAPAGPVVQAKAMAVGRIAGGRVCEGRDKNRWVALNNISVIPATRFHFDVRKSMRLRANPKCGIGFEEAQEILARHTISTSARMFQSSTVRFGWVGERLYSLIFEIGDDEEGECDPRVTLWKATREEQQLDEDHA